MTDRSAVDTIRGYFYQFDLSILSLLLLPNPSDSVEIECVEDIDIRTASDATAVQCKYYAKTDYNHSVIKEAVMHMATHFNEVKAGTKQKMSYVIRGHYASGQDKLNAGIDVEFLKKHFLTYTVKKVEHQHHLKLGLSDADLKSFLALLKVDINAPEFEKQFQDVLAQLKAAFSCSSFSAEFFYYNNALRVIRELSVKSSAADRRVTKKEFLEKIDTSSVLFNEWFVEKRGKKLHLAALRAEYFTELNISPFERFFLVEVDAANYVRADLKDLVFIISKKWSKLSTREPNPFCPYLFIHGIADDELLALKKELSVEGFKFIDGHDFQGADFSTSSIVQKASHNNGIKIKVLNSMSNLKETLDSLTKTRKLYQFHLGQSYFDYSNLSVGHVKIQVGQTSDIIGII
jgi:hypothetical protein